MSILQEIEDFLIVLRDNYGFLIPVDRLKLCLSCVTDITDVEEVLFRLQSLVCRNELQIDIFRSFFAQRFLGIHPKAGESGGEPKEKRPGPDDPLSQEDKEQLSWRSDQLEQLVKDEAEKKQKLLDEIKSLSEQQRRLRGETERAEEEIARMSEEKSKVLRSARVRAKGTKIQKDINKLDKLLDGLPSSFAQEIRSEVSRAGSKKDLNQTVQKLMKRASNARSANNSAMFSKYLAAVSAVKSLQSVIEKDILTTQEKQKVKELEHEMTARRKAIKAADEKQDSLNETSYQKNREYNAIASRIPRITSEREQIEQRLRVDREQQVKLIQKGAARTHRELFAGGVNAVQTTEAQAELMKASLTSMSADQKSLILSFIRANAKIFRQTLRRKSATPRKHQVDIRATMRAAARTNGEPIDICYKKPQKSHAKVIVVVDISGSCRQASTLALYFMGLMGGAFPGGCRKYAFVNHLVSVDKYFRDKSVGEGVDTVLQSVPTRGIYSNYGKTIHELREEIGGTIHKDTTVIVLGDARNNKNQSAVEDLKYIADRCHRVFWLNTDDPAKWNTGDSIIGIYESAGAEVHGIRTAGALIDFLGNLSFTKA